MEIRGYHYFFLFAVSSVIPFVTPLQELSETLFFDEFLEPLMDFNKGGSDSHYAKFSLRKPADPDADVCYIAPGNTKTLHNCNFNITSKTFLVIHGWTVSGIFESWVTKLVAALYERESDANVIVVDWLSAAQNHYVIAAQKTQRVGQEIARFIDWLEESAHFPLENLHLIGHSLGAHVAGFAGSHALNKVGRITGLDPAGPDFEGVQAHRRLSPDDAHFVDALHSFTHGSLGLSISIQQPVGHVDIYPNGGGFQPGCNLRGALQKIADFGIFDWPQAMSDAIRCENERSIHLFIDSLLNQREVGQAYRCGNSDMFNRGVCLSCRGDRCNKLGYGVHKIRRARSVKMYTKTRPSMPFRLYHYQLKIHFSCKVNQSEMEPSVTVSLYGANGDAENLQLNVKDKIVANKTHSFLLVTEKDIGDLLMIKFRWERATSMLRTVSSWWSGDSASSTGVEVAKIRVKAGETQKKMVFCVKGPQEHGLAQEVTFVKCKDGWKKKSNRPTQEER